MLYGNGIKMKNRFSVKNTGSVAIAISVLLTVGCQSTGGMMTKTEEIELVKMGLDAGYTDSNGVFWDEGISREFHLSESLSFNLPLSHIAECGLFSGFLKGKQGRLTITQVDSVNSNSDTVVIKGYASSDEYDISGCIAAVSFRADGSKTVFNLSNSFKYDVLPKLKDLKVAEMEKRQQVALGKQRQELDSKYKANWHRNELADTAEGIATIKVCMEKGVYFLPGDKRTQKVLRESESYARNDIKSKVDGKHYWDQQAYAQAHQKGLNKARYLWQHDYLTFSNQCAAMRNTVDSLTNK